MSIKEINSRNNTIVWVGILLAQMFLFWFLKNNAPLVSIFHNMNFCFQYFLQKIFSHIPISVGDVFYVILLALFLVFIIKKKWKTLFISINLMYFLFQFLWGVLYVSVPISNKMPKWDYQLSDLKTEANRYFEACNRANFHSKISDIELQNAIQNAVKTIPPEFKTSKPTANKSIKTSLFSRMLSYTGISGYYNPFTAEVQYNNNTPIGIKSFSLAHEVSHQLGYAREQEASFVGYLILSNSNNPELEYWANWYNLKRVLYEIESKDQAFVKEIQAKFNERMQSDRKKEQLFAREHQSVFVRIFSTTNDWFLKLNQQEGKISYSYYLDLLMRYNKKKNRVN